MFHNILTGSFVVFGRVRWLNESLVLLEPGAGLFMAGVTCVTLMSWTTNSCHDSAKATRSVYKLLCCLRHAFIVYICLLEHIMASYMTCKSLLITLSLYVCPYTFLLVNSTQASSKYMNCFLSPLLTVVAKNVAFFAGSLLAVLIALTIYDEDVLAVEHVLSSITLLGVCVTVCRYRLISTSTCSF